MDEGQAQTLLTRLEGSFDEYSNHDTELIRERISAYVSDLARKLEHQSGSNIDIPDAVRGFRRRYLEAVKVNIIAKQRHAHVLSKAHPSTSTQDGEAQNSNILSIRLDHLARQKQHSHLDIIGHHADELDNLSKSGPKFSRQSSGGEELPPSSNLGSKVDDRVEEARIWIRRLELAVIQARHSGNLEKARLRSAQAEIGLSCELTAAHQLRALGAVRTQLTEWLERSLTGCSTDLSIEASDDVKVEGRERASEVLQQAYEKYTEARRKLLHAAKSSSELQSSLLANVEEPDRHTVQIRPSGRVLDQVIRYEQDLANSEAKHSLQQIGLYLDNVLREERDVTLEVLQRLADESHLLPAYPILTRSEQFSSTLKTFGTKDVDETVDQIMDQTDAWTFAANASGSTTHETARKNIKRAHEAVEVAEENLKDLSTLNETVSKRDAFVP